MLLLIHLLHVSSESRLERKRESGLDNFVKAAGSDDGVKKRACSANVKSRN